MTYNVGRAAMAVAAQCAGLNGGCAATDSGRERPPPGRCGQWSKCVPPDAPGERGNAALGSVSNTTRPVSGEIEINGRYKEPRILGSGGRRLFRKASKVLLVCSEVSRTGSNRHRLLRRSLRRQVGKGQRFLLSPTENRMLA